MKRKIISIISGVVASLVVGLLGTMLVGMDTTSVDTTVAPAQQQPVNPNLFIKKLDISGKNRTAFPTDILAFKNLQELNVSNTNITTIPETIAQLTKLRKLNITGNPLTSFPKGILQLKNLEELTINQNLIDLFPHQIQRIGEPPRAATRFEKFIELKRQLNTLKKFWKLTIAGELNFSDQNITEIPKEAFKNLTVEGNLDLGHNPQLTTIQAGTFQGLTVGGDLDLSFNQLTTIQPGAFQGLTVKGGFYLYDNPLLTTIQAGAFQGLTVQGDLLLSDNPLLTTIQTGAFQGLTVEGDLGLSYNPLLTPEQIKAAREEFNAQRELLITAVKNNDMAAIKNIIYTTKIDINTKNRVGNSALSWAVTRNNYEIAKFLLEKGANVNTKDNQHRTPLMWAVLKENQKITKLLLDYGADKTIRNKYGQDVYDLAKTITMRSFLIKYKPQQPQPVEEEPIASPSGVPIGVRQK